MTTKTAPNVVNGLNVHDLLALIEGVKQDNTKGKTHWRVSTFWQGQTRSKSQVEGFAIAGEQVPRQFSINIDEPTELGGSNRFANPQEHLIAALNACMTVGYVAQCAVRGIKLESLTIETSGEIDLRGFLGIDPMVPRGYENLRYVVRIKGSATKEKFAEIHDAVMATSPNFYNISRPLYWFSKLARRSNCRFLRGFHSMTMLNTAPSYATVASTIQRKARFVLKYTGHMLNHWIASAIAKRARQADITFLCHLSDRELRDIGLYRGDLAGGLSEAARNRIRMQQSMRF